MTDAFPGKVIVSIDGVGAFDHVCRARIFEELLHDPALHQLILFVRQWYGDASHFKERDDNGNMYDIPQSDGGEQCGAQMPAFFV